ncbi:unnamed protein product, partial [Mesorhabditis belari]|uniref:Uncharacterized protein n=1 Tax=Mesorhabditis belari TaxID=2138241 RepID=A0AAF3FEC1_9BILA
MTHQSISFLVFLSLLKIITSSQPVSWFDCPHRCQCYEDPEDHTHSVHLICKWEQLNQTNLRTLARPEYVRTLTIRCPHLSKTKSRPAAGLFAGLRNLDRLEIDRCLLDELPADLFAGLTQLYSLIIRNARLDDLPASIFDHLPNLMTLDLTGNALKIEPYALRALRNVIHVDLSNNSIAFLANTLISMPKLRVLTIDHNRLTNIDFRRLPDELTDLSLRHNFISTLHYTPPSAQNLKRLDLSHNHLDFASGTGTVNVLPKGLKTVDLSHNRIAFIQDGTLERLEDLILFDLKNNSLGELRESSLTGPKNRLRLLISQNPFVCNCGLKWMVHPTTKSTPTVLDLDSVQCSHLLHPESLYNLTAADRKNELLCKYENQCPGSCSCCRLPLCECRIECPKGCQCYRSSRDDNENLLQNIIRCEGLRLDKIDEIPNSVTELQLSGDWRDWSPEKLGRLERMKLLNLSSTHLKAIESSQLETFPRLSAIDLSSNDFSQMPHLLPGITQLYMSNNPLKELTPKDLLMFDGLRKVALGGDRTGWECDCDAPSPLQRWLRDQGNREKVKDLASIYCALPLHGRVPIEKTLPDTNETLCAKEEPETSSWVKMMKNLEDRTSTIVIGVFEFSTTAQPAITNVDSSSRTPFLWLDGKGVPTHRYSPQRTTWKPPKRKAREDPDDSHRFLNALIFVLFLAVILLIIAVGITLYFRFTRTDVYIGSQHKVSSEQRPLNA